MKKNINIKLNNEITSKINRKISRKYLVKKIYEHIKDTLISIRCVIIKYNPIRYPIGIIECANPGPDSPVFVSGNYYLTVVRLKRALKNIQARILVADSAGINVWCAAGVGDFNEHKIADAVSAADLKILVNHRQLILPQLAAVGINLKKLNAECGFKGIWGPADLADIPGFINNGFKADPIMRLVRFPLKDRFINALGMFNIFLVFPALYALFKKKEKAHALVLINFLNIFFPFIFYNKIPFKNPSDKSLAAGVFTFIIVMLSCFSGPEYSAGSNHFRPGEKIFPGLKLLRFKLFWTGLINLMVTIDMLGSTPFYKTTIMHWLKTFNNKSLFQPQVTSGCKGCGKCLEVCPKGIFSLSKIDCLSDGKNLDSQKKPIKNKTRLVSRPDYSKECCECLACIKQCPFKAIKNLNGRVFKRDIKSIPGLYQA
jgi:ferredoxin